MLLGFSSRIVSPYSLSTTLRLLPGCSSVLSLVSRSRWRTRMPLWTLRPPTARASVRRQSHALPPTSRQPFRLPSALTTLVLPEPKRSQSLRPTTVTTAARAHLTAPAQRTLAQCRRPSRPTQTAGHISGAVAVPHLVLALAALGALPQASVAVRTAVASS